MVWSGHCLCGAATYDIVSDDSEIHRRLPLRLLPTAYWISFWFALPFPSSLRPQSSSSPSLHNLIFSRAFVLNINRKDLMVKGHTKRYTLTSAKGNETHRIFCSDCGSSVVNTSDDGKNLISIMAGALEMRQREKIYTELKWKPVSCLPPSF
jgi:hypothetical protein